MFPPGYHPFANAGPEPIGSANVTTVMMASTHRFSAGSPSQAVGGYASSALPKFGQAFGKRGSHLNEFNSPSPIQISSIQEPPLQARNWIYLMLSCEYYFHNCFNSR